jgi:very-short-patch-repair endonuclease
MARRLAAVQHGVVGRGQLRAQGVPTRSVRSMAASSRWCARGDEVLELVGSTDHLLRRFSAAVLDAGPGAVLSGTSAAHHWGLTGCPPSPVHTVRTSSSSRVPTLSRCTQVRALPERWVCELEGIPVLRPEYVALQLFAVYRAERAERLVERLWADRLLSARSLSALLDDLGRRGRNGVAGLRAYVEVRGPGYVPAASGVETRLLQILRDSGHEFDRQVDSGGESWSGRVDFRHRVLPLVIEVQSRRHHSALADRTADHVRRAQLERDGFTVLELTDTMIWTDPTEVVRRVDRALASCRTSRSVPSL